MSPAPTPSAATAPDDLPAEVDLIVLGGGTAGLLAATTAAGFGADVLMVERSPAPGGDCLWTGCVPSKTLLSVARSLATARAARAFLKDAPDAEPPVDFTAVMARVREAITTIAPDDSVETVQAAGVRVATASGRFVGPREAEVGGRRIRFDQAVVATGSEPVGLAALADADPLSTETVWSLTEQPGRLLVVGGGSSGCELAQAFARLGTAVTLVEARGRLLASEDATAAGLVAAALRADGVDVRLGTSVRRAAAGRAVLRDGSEIGFDRVLDVTGRRPRTADLGLEAAGVRTDERGYVVVDEHLRTSNERVWAAGDVTGHPAYTHVAGVHGSTVAANAVLGLRRSVAGAAYPRVTFTDPELAAVGVSPDQAGSGGLRVVSIPHRHVDRAVTEDEIAGLTRLVLDRRGRMRGAVVVGPRAGETIGEAALAVQQRVRVADLVAATHPYPTFSDGLWNAAVADYRRGLGRGATRLGVAGLRWWRRRTLARPEG